MDLHPIDPAPLPKVAWTVFRARESTGKTVAVSVAIVVFLAFTLWYFGILLALVALLALSVALHTYFLPIRYTFSSDGITVDKRIFSHTYPWDQFRAWFRTTGGVVVSPFSRRTFLDNFRGVHLLLPADPGEVLSYLEKKLPPRRRETDAEVQNDGKSGTPSP